MFGLSMKNCRVNFIGSHAEALAFYERCPARQGEDPGDERKISGKPNSPQMGVRLTKGKVAFRYHNTDVVTWHPDDTYTVETYNSKSTCEFANHFLPIGQALEFQGRAFRIDGVMYPAIGDITVRPKDGKVLGTQAFFVKEVIDRKAAKAVLAKTRYAEYRDWHKAMWPMVKDNMKGGWSRPVPTAWETIDLLEDETKWHNLMTSGMGQPEDVRQTIYSAHYSTVYYTKKETSLPYRRSLKPWEVSLK